MPAQPEAPSMDLECVEDLERAGTLLQPLRLEILRRARAPRSSTEIAAELTLPRQRVNYHVRELARAGFLRRAGRRRRRALWEQRWIATASAYVLSPDILGPIQADWRSVRDRLGASYLLALAARTQTELARAGEQAAERGQRIATLALDAELCFESAAQREGFAVALTAAVERVIGEHASPATLADGSRGPGLPFRLVLGCHPVPVTSSEQPSPAKQSSTGEPS